MGRKRNEPTALRRTPHMSTAACRTGLAEGSQPPCKRLPVGGQTLDTPTFRLPGPEQDWPPARGLSRVMGFPKLEGKLRQTHSSTVSTALRLFPPRTRPPTSSFGSQQPSQRPSQTPHSCPQTLQPLLPRQANDATKRCWKCGADATSRAPDAPPPVPRPRCPAPDAPPRSRGRASGPF